MKILLLDNYDSFTYNLQHYLEDISKESIDVFRNDEIDLEQINKYDAIVLSPGPGLPEEAGILISLIKEYGSTKKILGVCLGLQAMVVAYGGKLKQLDEVMHGLQRECIVKDRNNFLFKNISERFSAARYHSWVADADFLPKDFMITSLDDAGNIMSIQHRMHSLTGVQFHPESILTTTGKKILENWLIKVKAVNP